jgi:hypothetical protein
MVPTEHILLETECRQVPRLQDARRSHASAALRSRLRRRSVSLEIIDYYYLCVRSHLRSRQQEFTLDLRFVRPPQLVRHISWKWLAAALVLVAITAATTALLLASGGGLLRVLALGGALAAVATGTMFVCIYRTTETVTLFSTCGAARVLEFTGGLGTFRAVRPFLARLRAHIQLAAGARRRTKAEHLRDEMREHQRLKEIGALSLGEYEASKARILRQHTSAPRQSRFG